VNHHDRCDFRRNRLPHDTDPPLPTGERLGEGARPLRSRKRSDRKPPRSLRLSSKASPAWRGPTSPRRGRLGEGRAQREVEILPIAAPFRQSAFRFGCAHPCPPKEAGSGAIQALRALPARPPCSATASARRAFLNMDGPNRQTSRRKPLLRAKTQLPRPKPSASG
jgi:hypothetical protein